MRFRITESADRSMTKVEHDATLAFLNKVSYDNKEEIDKRTYKAMRDYLVYGESFINPPE